MGDLLGSPRVVPLVLLFSIIFLQLLLLFFFFFGASEWKALLRRARSSHLAKLGEHIFGLKIRRFDLQACRFHPYSILKAFLRSFWLILLYLFVVLCVLFYWVARGHV
jgi:hypothetical protein